MLDSAKDLYSAPSAEPTTTLELAASKENCMTCPTTSALSARPSILFTALETFRSSYRTTTYLPSGATDARSSTCSCCAPLSAISVSDTTKKDQPARIPMTSAPCAT